MFISKTTNGKVFNPEKVDYRKNTVKAIVSTYEGKNQNGERLYSNWRAFFVGDAYKKALTLKSNEKITLLKAKVDNFYSKEEDTNYVSLTVFDFEKENEIEEDEEEDEEEDMDIQDEDEIE